MKPIYQTDAGTIYHGHALEVLKALTDQSVNCVVTSPPYWGLRDYGLPPMVWGGLPDCDHKWGDHLKLHKGGPPGNGVMLAGGRRVCGEHEKTKDIIAGTFCQKCGAWLGSFGLEPTPELYTEHAVWIFREFRRVMKDDGTLWINLGDSYASGAGLYGNPGSDVQRQEHRKTSGCKESFTKGYPTFQPNRMPIPGLKPKDLVGIPWRVAFALQADGWYLRSDIIWAKKNCMPSSVKDRPTMSHEYIFLLSKSARYYYDYEAVKETATWRPSNHKVPNGWDTTNGQGGHGKIHRDGRSSGTKHLKRSGNKARKPRPDAPENNTGAVCGSVPWEGDTRNKRTVWYISTKPFKEAHFATFPPDLIEPCILAGCPRGGTVLDPFLGSGTTGIVCWKHERKFIGIDLSETYLKDIAIPRIERETRQLKLFSGGLPN